LRVFGPRAQAGPSQTSALAAYTHLDRAGAGWTMTFESDRFHDARATVNRLNRKPHAAAALRYATDMDSWSGTGAEHGFDH
jgi:hypothetical protein